MAFGSLPSVLGSGGGTAYSLIGGTGLFADGTAAAPSIAFAADTDTGVYKYQSNELGITLGGNATFRLVYSAGGYITGTGSRTDTALGLLATGAVSLIAGGASQNITLTPSGTGVVELTRASTTEYSVFRANRYDIGSGGSLVAITGLRNAFYIYDGTAGTTRYLLTSSGNHLLGTTTDSGNGILQLATHTTSAGGIGFGTDLAIHRTTSSEFKFVTAGTRALFVYADNSNSGIFSISNAGGPGIYFTTAGSTIIRSGGAVDALTLDTSQNATFAGAISTTGRLQITANGGITAAMQFVDANASGRTWQLGPGLASGSVNQFNLYDVAGAVIVASFTNVGNATFAGTVKPQLATTAGAPAYVKGAIYFDTTLNKLRVGGAAAWETITSV